MPPQTLAERKGTDWFDLVIQKLDVLRHDCVEIEDKSTVPSDARFELAKAEVEKLRRLANFPELPAANVWIGPSGELGITWRFPSGKALELLFADKMSARLYDEIEQAGLPLSKVPKVLARLVAQQENAA
jgi:hypothetical protein